MLCRVEDIEQTNASGSLGLVGRRAAASRSGRCSIGFTLGFRGFGDSSSGLCCLLLALGGGGGRLLRGSRLYE